MKYISLIKILEAYGHEMKTAGYLKALGYQAIQNSYERGMDMRPFLITQMVEQGTGQRMQTLRFHATDSIHGVYAVQFPNPFILPPVLEFEWLQQELELPKDVSEALEQLFYMLIMHLTAFLSEFRNRPITNGESEGIEYRRYMEQEGLIIDVEELGDAPAVLMPNPLSEMKLPKYRSYNTVLFYAADFRTFYHLCKEQSDSFHELYIHIPVMLALFMLSYCHDGLSQWSKHARLSMETEMKTHIENLVVVSSYQGDCTYARSGRITTADRDFIRSIFMIIRDKLHDMNQNLGLISYSTYSSVTGPETVSADVQLSGMTIDWKEEMLRVKEESESDDEEFDEN